MILFFIRNQVFTAIHKGVFNITLLKVGSGRGLRCWLLRECIKGICCSIGGGFVLFGSSAHIHNNICTY